MEGGRGGFSGTVGSARRQPGGGKKKKEEACLNGAGGPNGKGLIFVRLLGFRGLVAGWRLFFYFSARGLWRRRAAEQLVRPRLFVFAAAEDHPGLLCPAPPPLLQGGQGGSGAVFLVS